MPDSPKITPQKRSGFFADCSRREFERRLGRLQEEMERSGVDGLLLCIEPFFYHRGGIPSGR